MSNTDVFRMLYRYFVSHSRFFCKHLYISLLASRSTVVYLGVVQPAEAINRCRNLMNAAPNDYFAEM